MSLKEDVFRQIKEIDEKIQKSLFKPEVCKKCEFRIICAGECEKTH